MSEAETTRQTITGHLADACLALLLIALMIVEIWVFDRDGGGGLPVGTAVLATLLSIMAGAPIAFQRIRPFQAFGVNIIAIVALVAFTASSDVYQYTNMILLFWVGLHGRFSSTWLAPLLSVAGIIYYFRTFPDEGGPAVMAAVCLLWLVVWMAGRSLGSIQERDRLMNERDLSYELAETRKARLELESERTTMARELHDIIGHTLNVMLVHAGAARRALPENVEQATEALDIIETTGRSAMDDLDKVLGLLRAEGGGGGDGGGADRAPAPGLSDLTALAQNAADDRLDVNVVIDPAALEASRPVQSTLFRITQEAMTNVLKHAEASALAVTVDRRPDGIELRIVDDGIGLGGRPPGRGLSGMEQRAALLGGTVEVGSAPDGGTAIRCLLPFDGSPLDTASTDREPTDRESTDRQSTDRESTDR